MKKLALAALAAALVSGCASAPVAHRNLAGESTSEEVVGLSGRQQVPGFKLFMKCRQKGLTPDRNFRIHESVIQDMADKMSGTYYTHVYYNEGEGPALRGSISLMSGKISTIIIQLKEMDIDLQFIGTDDPKHFKLYLGTDRTTPFDNECELLP